MFLQGLITAVWIQASVSKLSFSATLKHQAVGAQALTEALFAIEKLGSCQRAVGPGQNPMLSADETIIDPQTVSLGVTSTYRGAGISLSQWAPIQNTHSPPWL